MWGELRGLGLRLRALSRRPPPGAPERFSLPRSPQRSGHPGVLGLGRPAVNSKNSPYLPTAYSGVGRKSSNHTGARKDLGKVQPVSGGGECGKTKVRLFPLGDDQTPETFFIFFCIIKLSTSLIALKLL